MLTNEINNDINFKQACSKYGLNYEKFEVYGDVILVLTPKKDLYVLFDKNYNTIGIEKRGSIFKDNELFAKDFYERYSSFSDMLPFGDVFGYPFEEYTLKDFIDISSKINMIKINHGHDYTINIDGQCFEKNDENKEYFELLSYIKFIAERIKQYFLINYHMQMMGFEIDDIYSYIRTLINKINCYVEYNTNDFKRVWPSDVIMFLGLNNKELNCDNLLFDICDLLMRENGVRVKSGEPEVLEQLPVFYEKKDLYVLSNNLLKLIDCSDENLELYNKIMIKKSN